MRSIWTGAIGFGLVNIPIKLFSATSESSLDLDMLDKKGFANIRYARINANTGKEVPWENIVKGYKYHDEYVVLTDEDFAQVSPKKSRIIDIGEFTNEAALEAAYYDKPYYAEPAKGGEKAYVLLREALKQSGKVAVGSFVLRNKENLCIVRAREAVLILQKLRFPEEIKGYSDLNIPGEVSLKPGELKMAQALINQLTPKKFNLSKYKDNYDNELMKIIEAKAKGKKLKKQVFKVVHNKNKDLMDQLKESLQTATRKKAS